MLPMTAAPQRIRSVASPAAAAKASTSPAASRGLTTRARARPGGEEGRRHALEPVARPLAEGDAAEGRHLRQTRREILYINSVM